MTIHKLKQCPYQEIFLMSIYYSSSSCSNLDKRKEQLHMGSEEHLKKNLATHSSKCPSPSSSTSSSHNNSIPINSKTMEEVWKDISLSCSRDHMDPQNITTTSSNCFGGLILQDLLARPFANDPSPPPTACGSPVTSLPATMLTLNFAPEIHFFSSLNPLRQTEQKDRSSLASPAAGRKRHPESDNNSGDQRNKRMIKNRESAARSRARKQAYTNELEMEVANLMKENARLKRQQEQLCLATAGAQLPKKNSLYRTSTAPF